MIKYETLEKIASGSFGSVFKAVEKLSGRHVAIKVFVDPLAASDKGICTTILRELVFCTRLDYPYVIRAQDSFLHQDKVHMVMEYCDSSLAEMVRNGQLNDPISMVFQLLSGVAYLHDNGVIHRDLKPDNILFVKGQLKIADFGHSILVPRNSSPQNTKQRVLSTKMFSASFRPPEVLLGDGHYDYRADMWCVGAIIFEIITKKPLLQTKGDKEQLLEMYSIFGYVNESTWEGVSTLPNYLEFHQASTKATCFESLFPKNADLRWMDLIASLLTLNPKGRASAKECLQHSLFDNIHKATNSTPVSRPLSLLLDCKNDSKDNLSEHSRCVVVNWMAKIQTGQSLCIGNLATSLWNSFVDGTSKIATTNAQLWAITCIRFATKLCGDEYSSSQYLSQWSGVTIPPWLFDECEIHLFQTLLNFG